jgi:putative transposase
LFVTWRLYGSLPVSRRESQKDMTPGQAFRAWDSLLDTASQGPVWLRDPQIASMVVSVLRQGESERNFYRLAAFAVLSNHVHVLIEPRAPTAKIMQWIKGTTAREANKLLNRTGEPFWQQESYDHWVRGYDEFQRVVRYIEFNPVRIGLVDSVEKWPWSSAYERTS